MSVFLTLANIGPQCSYGGGDVANRLYEREAASQIAMDYGFTTVSCKLLPLETGRDKNLLRRVLEPLDLGVWLDLGPRGLRLIPHDFSLPPTYFNPDGSVDLVNKGLYLDDVMSHMERIAAALGCQLEWEWD